MRIDIIFGILLTLINNKETTASYLAEKYEISTKTVYRYLTILDSNNIPIYTKKGKNGGIFLKNKFCFNNMFLTSNEKTTLLNLCNKIENESLKQSLQIKLQSIK